MALVGSVMVPHPPIILPEIGRGEEKKIQRDHRSVVQIRIPFSHGPCGKLISVTKPA